MEIGLRLLGERRYFPTNRAFTSEQLSAIVAKHENEKKTELKNRLSELLNPDYVRRYPSEEFANTFFSEDGRKGKRDETAIFIFREIKKMVLEIFDVKNFQEAYPKIKEIEKDQNEINNFNYSFSAWLCDSLYMEYSDNIEASHFLNRATQHVNNFLGSIQRPAEGFVLNGSGYEYNNEVNHLDSPFELLKIIFRPQTEEKTRYQAITKLVLMKFALSMEKDSARTDINEETGLAIFDKLMAEVVFNGDGQSVTEEKIFSLHSKKDLSCIEVSYSKPFSKSKLEENSANYYRQEVLHTRTILLNNNKEIKIYAPSRLKNPYSILSKLIRNGSTESTNITDMNGYQIVLQNLKDLHSILGYFKKRFHEEGINFQVNNIESKNKNGYEAIHFDVKFNSKNSKGEVKEHLIEMHAHSIEAYLDNNYRDGTDHREYEITRNQRIYELLYPPDLYNLELDVRGEQSIKNLRAMKRLFNFTPVEDILKQTLEE